MSQENVQDKDFEAYSKLDYEAKLNELYVYGRNDRRTLRAIAKNVSTILEIVEALAGKQFKETGFETPSVPKVQQPKQVQQKPKPTPEPESSESKVDASGTQWIPLREEVAVFKEEWKEGQYGWSAYSEDYPELACAIKNSYKGQLSYGDMYFKLGGNDDAFINLYETGMKNRDGKPSEGQINYATKLKIENPEGYTKVELSKAIAETQLEERRAKL